MLMNSPFSIPPFPFPNSPFLFPVSYIPDATQHCLQKAHYAAEEMRRSERFELAWSQPFYKEFVIRDRVGKVEPLMVAAREHGILAGVPLGRWYPELDDCFLVAVTEQRTRAQIDALANCLTTCNDTKATIHA